MSEMGEVQALIDKVNADWEAVRGRDRLWRWFGLSRASWLTVPRVLMHEMPEDWQDRMARLLEEFAEEFPDWTDGHQLYVAARDGSKFTRLPDWLCNYRHPYKDKIAARRRASLHEGEAER